MASVRTSRSVRVFVDSSVFMAAAISSRGAARQMLLLGFRPDIELCFAPIVLEETERNLARKAPDGLSAFRALRAALPGEVVRPGKRLVMRLAGFVELKDAPIVAGAVLARAHYLATYDRRHLLSKAEEIQAKLGLAVATPEEVLRAVAGDVDELPQR